MRSRTPRPSSASFNQLYTRRVTPPKSKRQGSKSPHKLLSLNDWSCVKWQHLNTPEKDPDVALLDIQ
jgi:hypothetical protein